MAWDLRYPDTSASVPTPSPERDGDRRGMLAAPGSYTVTLVKIVEGETTALAGPVSFEVERMRNGALEGASPEETVAFWQQLAATQRATTAATRAIARAFERTEELRVALGRSLFRPEQPRRRASRHRAGALRDRGGPERQPLARAPSGSRTSTR